MMVTGGVLQQEATKLGLGKVEASARTLSGPAAVTDALLSGSASYDLFWETAYSQQGD